MARYFEMLWHIETGLESGTGSEPPTPLSNREDEVARLVAQGLTNRDIALRLGIAEGTVKAHLNHVFEKFQIRSRTELAVLLAHSDRRL